MITGRENTTPYQEEYHHPHNESRNILDEESGTSSQQSLCLYTPILFRLTPQPITAVQRALHTFYHSTDKPIPRTPYCMLGYINTVRTEAILTVDDDCKRCNSGENGCERCGGRYHKHDNHLEPRRLLDRRATKDST